MLHHYNKEVHMERGSKSITVTIILSLLFGGIIGYALHRPKDEPAVQSASPVQAVSSKAADLRARLNTLFVEHAAVTVPALKSTLENTPDAAAANAAVDRNSSLLAAEIDTLYPGKKDEFLNLWNLHVMHYKDYLTAAAAGNESGKERAKQNLSAFSEQLSSFFVQNTPQANKDELKSAIATHGDQVISIIDSLVAKKYDTVYTTADAAIMHMNDMATMLAQVFVEQHPDQY